MTEIDAEVKKWGNSLGIRVPASLAHDQGILPGDTVRVRIEKMRTPAASAFGAGRRSLARYEARIRARKTELLREEGVRERRIGRA